MPGPTLRTVQKRENRAKHKNRYHHLAFIAEYTQRKYKEIYKEADRFYQKLYPLYPNKTKLTTCIEFKVWESEIKKLQDSATITRMPDVETTTRMQDEETTTRMQDEETTTRMPDEETTTRMPDEETTTRMPYNIQINIPLMSAAEVQETRDTVMLQDIYPSLTEEINPEILEQVIRDIQETDIARDIFNDEYDEDINDILNIEINNSMNELSALEKELLNY